MPRPRITGKELTRHLRDLAAEAEGLAENGDVLTKAQALARLLWRKALGYEDMQPNREGVLVKTIHMPESWAIQLIYERIEGKAGPTTVEEAGKITATERVSELARNRINSLAGSAVGISAKPLPPKLSRKDKD
jgi:hypothetical protein